jgi:hypothetical protein
MMPWRRERAETLAALLEGELGAPERTRLEAELAASAELRGQLSQLEHICQALAAPVPELDALDLADAVRAGVRRAAARSAERPPGWARWGACAAGALAFAGVLVVRFGLSASDPEFRAKSAAPADATARWAGVQVYRVTEGDTPERLGEHIAASDGLLFAYTNLGPAPFERLMLFARGADGRIHWFYPAYERADSDPESVPIVNGGVQVALGEVIHHDFQPGPLVIYAAFSRHALRVSEVEASLAQGVEAASPALPDDASLWVFQTQVGP